MTTTEQQSDTLSRESILARVSAAINEGRPLRELTETQALGLTAAEIAAAREGGEVRAPRVGRDFVRHRTSTLRQKITTAYPLTVVGMGGRQLVADQVKPLIEALGVEVLLEMTKFPGHPDLLTRIPEGMLTVHFSTSFGENVCEHDGMSYQTAEQSIVDAFENSPSWEVFTAPWDDEIPAFAIKTGEDTQDGRLGRNATIVVLLNLFGTETGQYVRTANNFEKRLACFEQIMRLSLPLLTAAFRHPDPNARSRATEIQEALSTFASLRAFGERALGGIQTDLDNANREIAAARERITHHQQRLLHYIRSEQENAERVRLLSSNQSERIVTVLEAALGNLDRIKQLRAVQSVELTTREGRPALYIKLYNVAAKSTGRYGEDEQELIFCKNLAFWLMLNESETYPFVWDTSGKPSGQPSLHPNIYSGGDTCWGELSSTITTRMGERDWNAVVTLTIRMLQNVGFPVATGGDSLTGFRRARPGTLPGFQYPGRTA